MLNDRFTFRGKRVDNGEWVTGYYIYYEHMGEISHFIATGFAQIYVDSYKVDPATIGQCTGLRDRNGKLIYEGDVMRHEKVAGPVIFVRWGTGLAAGFYYTDVPRNDELYREMAYQSFAKQCEIIGNVHDNPELLMQTKTPPYETECKDQNGLSLSEGDAVKINIGDEEGRKSLAVHRATIIKAPGGLAVTCSGIRRGDIPLHEICDSLFYVVTKDVTADG